MTPRFPSRASIGAAAALAAVLLLQAARALFGAPFSVRSLIEGILFAVVVLIGARSAEPARLQGGRWRIPAAGLLVAGLGAAAAFAAATTRADGAAWTALALFEAAVLAAALPTAAPGRRAPRAAWILFLAAAAGGVPLLGVEIESDFAHEELFVAIGAIALAAAWLAFWLAARRLFPRRSAPPTRGLSVRGGVAEAAALAAGAAVLAYSIAAWQRSFSPPDAPAFPGVSAAEPFLCGEVARGPDAVDGRRVFADLVAAVERNPRKGTPETGMLALATGDPRWAAAFRSALLEEARSGEFSRHGETKYWQYEASLRAYYYPRARAAFPALFSPEETARLAAWFHAINRRALSRSLDDVIYALAFAKAPEGPYENQENGAGLLALLEAGGLAAPDLSARNRRYLDGQARGWDARFRNNDDSFGYQSEWIHNALFQSLRKGGPPPAAMRRSFEWLLLQAEPDGFPPDYNAAVAPRLPATAYLGAALLSDPQMLWLAARSLAAFRARGLPLAAEPGAERPIDLEAQAPTAGSCLLYADSGLPNRVGPLAPDKIVLREGWSAPSAYLLWNLRFSGWHRYRATNAVVTLRLGEPVAGEKRGSPFSWLPLERRIFRDKRIPREFTNGLLVEADGLAAAIARLTGFGGPWAQDPPHFARVEEFRTGAEADRAAAAISGWRGWRHRRAIHFFRGGPIVVVDRAQGPSRRSAAVAWHVSGRPGSDPSRFRLGREGAAELVLLPLQARAGRIESREGSGPFALDLLYRAAGPGSLELASVFLPAAWSGAGLRVARAAEGASLEIEGHGVRVSVPLP